jgi:hypothetical protein
MIYTMQTFQIEPKNYDEFVRLSEEEIWPALESQGAQALGLWIRVAGGAERLLQMTRYDSIAHWQETQHWNQPSDTLQETLSEYLQLVNDTDLVVLSPLTRRQPEGDAPESEPGIYALRRFDVELENIRRLVELSEDGWWPWVTKGQGIRPLGQWLSIVAPEMRIYMLARYNDLAHWEATRGPGPEPTDPEMYSLWDRGRSQLRERSAMTRQTDVCFLRPISRRRP